MNVYEEKKTMWLHLPVYDRGLVAIHKRLSYILIKFYVFNKLRDVTQLCMDSHF